MWTPKRVVLMAVGFFVFFSGYMLYASCLGGIDGLPPLPVVDYPPEPGQESEPQPPSHGLKMEDKLRQAFGQDCQELKWPLKLEMNAKNMVVAARDFTIGDDGRLDLDMLSVAMFGKDLNDGRGIEINTIRAKRAFLTFDKPLGKNEKEFTGRRIVGAELDDDIEIVNNHRTPQRDDDLHVFIDKGPLYYDEVKHLIWTDDDVHLEDVQNQSPTDVRGRGLEVTLTPAEAHPEAKPAPRGKAHSESFSGVERIVLKSDVVMDLFVAPGGFLANDAKPPAKAAPAPAADTPPAAKAEKAKLRICTPGRFQYDFRKDGDLAHFEAPYADPAHPQNAAPLVTVDRITASSDPKATPLYDRLLCRRLELRMRSKNPDGPRDETTPDHGLEVESAHAVAAAPSEVVLTSDAQDLEAHGNDFQFNARTKLTVLQGDPAKPDSGMWADQAGNKIHAHDLQIQDQQGPDGKAWRQVTAKGPGRIDFKDASAPTEKNTDKSAEKKADKKDDKKPDRPTLHAAWQDKLISTRDGAQDLMILLGAASFVDDEHEQTLQSETLKVWMLPTDAAATPGAPPPQTPGPQQGRRPTHIEATDNVFVRSPTMNIPHAGQLVIVFHDVPASELPSPAAPAPAPAGEADKGTGGQGDKGTKGQGDKDTTAAPAVPLSPLPLVPLSASPAAAPAKEEPAPAKPINLTARSVFASVARADQKSALEKMHAEGDVEVHQDPAKADEKGVDVKGDALDMTCHPDGNFLVVQGDLAQLRMDKIFIIGPEVNIDQASNKAWVWGAGAMQMESESNFQGEKLAKPVPLTVEWNKEMFFNGRYAEFSDHVQAEQEQDNAHLACESLQVFFDRAISLKEGNRDGPPPRVKNMVCYKDVLLEEKTLEGDKVVRQQRMVVREMAMTTIEPDGGAAKQDAGSEGNEIRAPGPGELRLFQAGGQDPLAPPTGAAPAPPGPKTESKPKKVTASKPGPDGKAPAAKDVPGGKAPTAAKSEDATKLTYILYGDGSGGGSMYANSKTNTATFLGHVRVLNMPCDDPDIKIDLDDLITRLPEGAMYLQSDRLDVFDHGDKKQPQQEMFAKGHVLVQAREFWGRSDTMTFNEAKDQIIFKGGEGGLATLYKIKQRGAPPQKIEGKEIIYIRSTGMFQIEGGEWISGSGS